MEINPPCGNLLFPVKHLVGVKIENVAQGSFYPCPWCSGVDWMMAKE